jgi:NAD(P)-dependent dehydrogenase (short-subunit alcohol dehydrogenase family)
VSIRGKGRELKPQLSDTRSLVVFQARTFSLPISSEPVATFGQAKRAAPEAVTPAFVFFACADSDYITGQVLAVDGGLTA